jgi:hypothetical protein
LQARDFGIDGGFWRSAGVCPTRAIARWPAVAELFKRKCDVDRAEAALVAMAGLKRDTGK